MTAADALGMIAGQGAEQVAITALRVLAWPALALAVALPLLAARRYFRRRKGTLPLAALPPADPCPCCTGEPYRNNDCTCREDCGVPWCQAADPECPWCDTRECIDRDLCNCAGPCGSWLCVVKEESR